MWLLTIGLSIVFSIFSTVVMSYLTMAIPIGPWIAPTLALLGMLIFGFFSGSVSKKESNIVLVVSAGSVGGILANAFAFYFPTFYFLDRAYFNSWMASPIYFCCMLTGLGLLSGWFGLWIANLFEQKFIVQENLSFPIGQLVHQTIIAQGQMKKALELIVGFFSTGIFCLLQDGLWSFNGFIPKSITLLSPRMLSIFHIPLVSLDIWPMLWALGFVTGHVIALPLAVGVLAKFFLAGPINSFIFPVIPSLEFMLTFSTGLVLFSAVTGFIATPKSLWKAVKNIMHGSFSKSKNKQSRLVQDFRSYFVEFGLLIIPMVAFLYYLGFSLLAQLYLIPFTFVCAYQIANIAGKIGFAFMGRFSTFVMVPAMFLFALNSMQIAVLVTFVGLVGGVATDILFGRKLARLANVSLVRIKRYQYLGLLVSALSVGIVFWLLINHFGLGSKELFAYRAQNRGLLIDVLRNAKSFNLYVLILGFLFGYIVQKMKISPMLVLGGLFMPINVSLGLVIGGFGAFLTKNKEKWFPFWSGVYAANSIWMLIRAIL